jgi:tetratricopeptide (TPR) repeat protein
MDVGNLYIDSLINLGINYKNDRHFEEAEECYEKVLKLNPNEESALFNYGMCIS